MILAAVLAMGAGHFQWHDMAIERGTSPQISSDAEAIPIAIRYTAREAPPPDVDPGAPDRYPMPIYKGAPMDQSFTSLQHWIHPVSASAERVPTFPARLFGQPREGLHKHRRECGRGHCGIDLDGPRGRALVAVADGKIIRVERRASGGDGISGRFVKLRHDDGTFTTYMHMDEVGDKLVVGERIAAGTYIGTLGATAVFSAPPHLHFSLELPNHPGRADQQGDHEDTRFTDPSPFLARAKIVPVPDKRQRNALRAF